MCWTLLVSFILHFLIEQHFVRLNRKQYQYSPYYYASVFFLKADTPMMFINLSSQKLESFNIAIKIISRRFPVQTVWPVQASFSRLAPHIWTQVYSGSWEIVCGVVSSIVALGLSLNSPFFHIIKTFSPKLILPKISHIFRDQQSMLNALQETEVTISSIFIPGLIETTSQ